MRHANWLIAIVISSFFSAGCATKLRTTLLGVGVGAAAGTLAVGLHDATVPSAKPDYSRNLTIGAAVGGLLGGGLLYLHHHLKEKREDDIIRSTTDAFLLHRDTSEPQTQARGDTTPWIYLKDPSRIEWVEPYFDEDEALHERHRRFFIYKRTTARKEPKDAGKQ